jgi:hypothetical protein
MHRRHAILYAAIGIVWLTLAWFDDRRGEQLWMLIDLMLALLLFSLAFREWQKA